MQNTVDLILDFTHTYAEGFSESGSFLQYIDCSDIEGTDMYCTPEAEEELCRRIAAYPLQGIHFIDSGNYHYMTGLFTRRMKEPYNLLFFDNHSDMQPTMIPELLSCGAWAKHVLEEDENLRKLVLIGPPVRTLAEIEAGNREKLVCVSWEELESGVGRTALHSVWEQLDAALPLYLSIDKDVLSEEYARTNWDQGTMPLPLLMDILREICQRYHIVGADICGELPDAPAWQEAEVRRINEKTNRELYLLLKQSIR